MLDTSVVSNLINDPTGKVAARILALGYDNICVSTIAAAELRYGAARNQSKKLRRMIDDLFEEVEFVNFDREAADEYGRLRAEMEAVGKPLGPNDMLIAAHAKSIGATLATLDGDFLGAADFVKISKW